jgi:hypothetical protein
MVSASPAVLGTASAGSGEYDEVVDIVEAGADNTGQEPIDEVFDEHAADDTRIEFPDGTYKVDQLIVYQLSNFAMVGTGDATLVPGENYDADEWIAGAETRDLTIEGFTIDNTASGVAPEITLSAYDGLTIRDVRKRGFHSGTGIAVAVKMLDGGDAVVEGLVAPDGGKCVGVYAHGEGSMTFRRCHLEGFTNNGLYASRLTGPATVEGGLFKDNNIAQVRLGSPDSVVRNATIEVTRPVKGPDSDVVNMRGIRIADGAGPVTISNCDFSMLGSQGTGGVVTAYSGGSLEVYDTRIYIDEAYTIPSSDGSRTSWGVFVDDANGVDPGSRTFENVSITGGGRYRSAMLIRRSDNDMRGVCIDQDGEGRDGIVFEDSSGNTVSDSVVDVPDEEFVLRNSSVKRSDVSTSGSCPAPGDATSRATAQLPGEVGRSTVEQTTADEWHTVGFERQYDRPVVVAQPLSYEGYHPCHVRVRDVTASDFDLQLEEWMYLDGDHRPETVSHVALEAGTYSTDDLAVEAGFARTNHEFTGVGFDQSFDTTPVVFAQSQTYEGTDPIVTRLRDVDPSGFDVRVQEEEGEENGGYHFEEQVGYVAVEPGTGTLDGRAFEVDTYGDGVDDSWSRIEFERSYDAPRFVADMQTFNGPNTANLRYRNLTSESVEVFVEEERSADSETDHFDERVGYAVFEGA